MKAVDELMDFMEDKGASLMVKDKAFLKVLTKNAPSRRTDSSDSEPQRGSLNSPTPTPGKNE